MKLIFQEEGDNKKIKNMKAIILNNMKAIISFTIILCVQSCEKLAMDRDYPLYVLNESNHSIKVYFNDDANHSALYPDTLISDFEDRLSIEIPIGGKKSVAGGDATWENIFEVSAPSDTLSLFVFHTDTLSKYNWDVIRNQYKILKRYDISLADLRQIDFTITYPPDSSMEGIQMYPE